jgi:hypothetical protein
MEPLLQILKEDKVLSGANVDAAATLRIIMITALKKAKKRISLPT